MEELLSIKAVAAIKKMKITELSELTEIPYERLINLNSGKSIVTRY